MLNPIINSALGTFGSLFPITNPIGAIPIFYSLTANAGSVFRKRQAKRTSINVIGVLVVFLLAGQFILGLFGLSLGVLKIAGGMLVGHTAWEMVTAKQRLTPIENETAMEKEDISFTPMAIPLVSGPGAIGVVIGQAEANHNWANYLGSLLGIVGLGMVLYLFLMLGEPLIQALGKNEIGALNRVLGFFILAIAVQLISEGVMAILP